MDTRMAEYIMILLKSRYQVMWSWGSCKFIPLTNGLMCHVQGYLLNGWVKVLYNEATDAFDVFFQSNQQKVKETVNEVYLDNLVDAIDYHVENNGSFNYAERVHKQYSF